MFCLAFLSQFFLDIMIFTVRNKTQTLNIPKDVCNQRIMWRWQAEVPSFGYIFVSKEQATKTESRRETDGQWVITPDLMTYVGSTCLFTHIFAKK